MAFVARRSMTYRVRWTAGTARGIEVGPANGRVAGTAVTGPEPLAAESRIWNPPLWASDQERNPDGS